MLGNKSGVAKRLLDFCPYLIVNHCVAHKLALACKDASKEIEFYEKAEELMSRIYNFFKKSSTRTQELKNYQELLDCPQYKIKKIYKIRWLSWYEAIKNVCDTLPALIEMLSNDYSEVSVNLYEDLCNWRMIGFFYFLYDILSHLTKLSKFFQRENLRFCDIRPMIEGTINSIEKEYVNINDAQHFFGVNFQNLMIITNPFNSPPNIGSHSLKFTNEDYDDLIVDIYRYSSSVVEEIKNRFPNVELIDSFKILNPREWNLTNDNISSYGRKELSVLLEHFGKEKESNDKYFNPLIKKNECQDEWMIYKTIIKSNFDKMKIEAILPILIKEYSDVFPNIVKLIKIAYTVPFSSVPCERGFSKQNL